MDESIITRMVQIGKVNAVQGQKAKVQFDNGVISDWLPALQIPGAVVNVAGSGTHSHDITVSEGSATASTAPNHTHTASVTTWTPKIGQVVAVLYLPVFNSDGFILGVITS